MACLDGDVEMMSCGCEVRGFWCGGSENKRDGSSDSNRSIWKSRNVTKVINVCLGFARYLSTAQFDLSLRSRIAPSRIR